MKLMKFLLVVLLATGIEFVSAQSKYAWKTATAAGYTYKYVSNDPIHARFYTLKNGLTVVLSPNKKEPRISVRIPVRAGSNTDPADHTGLAHYLEHLLFKGTDKFGSLDWAKEKPLLDQIDALYEQYNSTKDEAKRKEIYAQIDKVSGEASKYSIANEYDKMLTAMGSQGTNAHTWVEETVYDEDIPSNAVDKLLAVQSERFRNPILRIFHTELEAVYEEKNGSLDEDAWKLQEASHYYLFPTHNYGQQTTIGTIQHLKNPSIKAIRDYYYKYYVPNNMAIVMAGDFDPDQLIKKIDESFAYMKPKPIDEYKPGPERALTEPVIKDIYGPSAERLQLLYRVGPAFSRDEMLVDIISKILANGKAGLLDLNLNKQQKVLSSGASKRNYKDYGVFTISASPKQGQTLEEVKDLLMSQIDLLKKGEFDESLLKAIVANSKLSLLQAFENNSFRTSAIVDDYIKSKGEKWAADIAWQDEMSKVTKKEIVDFANKFFVNNYVLLYKRKGEDKNIVKVDKPAITPITTNADKQSPFLKAVNDKPLAPLKPVWLDYTKDFQKSKMGNAEVLYVPNKDNSLFRLYYNYDMGTWNNKNLSLALQYLQFVGTDKYTPEQISKEFYNLACSFTSSVGTEQTNITISGLQENFDKAVTLFEEILRNCKADQAALDGLKNRLARARTNNKLNKNAIMSALRSYGTYGANNPFNYTYTNDELKNLKPEDLIAILHSLADYQHRIIYYGPKPLAELTTGLQKLHKLPATWTAIPAPVKFERTIQKNNQVLFADYDMVQAEIYWIRNLETYDPKSEAVIGLFNNYFGAGSMGSVVFQTIRESKALAYSTFAVLQTPSKKTDNYAFIAYVGSQADKFHQAIPGMNELLNDLPQAEQTFDNAKKSMLKDIATERISKDDIIFNYLANKRKGVDHDLRKDIYTQAEALTFADIKKLHTAEFANMPYTYCIVASEKKVSTDDLKKYGEVKKINLEQLFGY